MIEQFELSLVVPTYNRLDCLKELIPSLVEECEKVNHQRLRVELIVSDNASTDGTGEYLQSMLPGIKRDWFKYYRNPANLGGDRNFILSIQRAKGRYVWLFGDDELILTDGVKKVCWAIEQNPSLIIVKAEDQVRSLEQPRLFRDYHELVAFMSKWNPYYVLAHTLITSNVYLKSLFDPRTAEQMRPSNYGHMYAIMANLKKMGGGVFVFTDPIFSIRQERAGYANPPRYLGWKQAQYINYIGRLYCNWRLYFYSIVYFLPELKGWLFRFFKIRQLRAVWRKRWEPRR